MYFEKKLLSLFKGGSILARWSGFYRSDWLPNQNIQLIISLFSKASLHDHLKKIGILFNMSRKMQVKITKYNKVINIYFM